VTLSGLESGATYQYSTDGGSTWTTTAGTISLTSLSEGSQSLKIKGTDAAGNTSSISTFNWTTDYTVPTISSYSRSATPTTGNTADIGVTITASESSTVSYSTDGGTTWSATTPNLSPGSYSLLFKATDAAGNESAPSSFDFILSRYSLSGNFYGCIAGVTGSATGEVVGISNQNWGGWSMSLSGTGSPTPNASWTVYAGGRSTDSVTTANNNGYWIDIASGTSDYDAKTLTGTSSLKYLSLDRKGTGTGTFTGTYDGLGSYTLADSGSNYTETPLVFSAMPTATLGATKSFGYWDFTAHSPVYQTSGEVSVPLASIEGQLGATTSLFTNLQTVGSQQLYDPASITGLGTYATNSYPFFSMNFDAYNLSGGDFGTGGGVQLSFGGIHVNDQIKGKLRGLYWRPLGDGYYETGLLISNLVTASLYPSIGMWELPAADLTAEKKGTIGPLEAEPVIGTSPMDGRIGATAYIKGGSRSFFSDNAQTTKVPWGLMSGTFGGTGTIPASTDTVNAGGRLLNGETPTGYWLAKFTAAAPDSDGFFTGTIADGRHITVFSQGTASGTLAGLQDGANYQGIFGLPYSGTVNLITGQTTSTDGNAFKSWDFTLTNPHNIESGAFNGIFGSTASILPSGSASLLAMGTYTNPDGRPLWGINIAGSDTSAGMTILGRMGGTASGTSLNGSLVALGIRTDGGVNYAYQMAVPAGLSSGSLYSSIGMWEASGNMEVIRGGLATSVAPADLFEGNTATPSLTWNGGRGYDADPLLGKIAGSGVTGNFRPKSIGLNLSNNQFLEIHYGEAGGTYTGTPQVGDTYVSGITELKSDNVTIDGYSVSHGTLTSWADGKFTASYTGKTLLKDALVEYTTKNYGVYAGGQWQAIFAGTGIGTPLNFSASLSGGLNSTVSGTIVSKDYQSPFIRYYGGLDELKYETVYFKPASASFNSTRMFAFEQSERIENKGTSGEFTHKDEYDYFTNDRYIKIRKGWGVTSMGEAGVTSTLSPLPDFSKDPPDTPSTHVDTTKFIYPYTAGGTILEGQYVKTSEDNWTGVTSLVRGNDFAGLLGILTGANTFWTSTSGAPVNIYLAGTHGSYSGAQVFKTNVLGNLTSGGFYSQLLGIIPDTAAAEKPLEGMVIGLYVNPAGTEAGIVKGSFTGLSYTDIGMWESDSGSLYRIPKATGTFTQPWTEDGYGGYTQVYRGPIGPAVNSGLRGSFGNAGSGVGVIDSPLGIMGSTISIVGQPDWGGYAFSIGILNTYTKPTGSPSNWTATLFGSGWFGRDGTYTDAGYWKAAVSDSDSTWTGGKLSGTLTGEFLTYTKLGTLEGILKGTYDASSWQAVSAGTWAKTQPVLFSSEVWGSSYILKHQQAGSKSYDNGAYYSYDYDDQGSARYGYGEYTDSSGNKTTVKFDQYGPNNNVRYKNVWTYDHTSGNYTLNQTTYADDATYWAAMASLQTNPVLGGDPVTPHDQWRMDDWRNMGGIMAGLDNLWANLGTSTPTSLKFLGDLDSFDAARVGFNLFGGQIVSFDPRVTTQPFDDSQTPTVGGLYGAYSGYVGAVANSSNAVDGFVKTIYMDKNRNVGIMYGSLTTGTVYPYPGMWEATGSALTYQMNAYTAIPGDWDTHNFASKLSAYSQEKWRSYYPAITAANVDSGSLIMGADSSQTVGFGFGNSEPGWRLSFIAPGGTYSGTPTKWTMTFDDPSVSHVRRNFLTASIVRLTGNAFSGNLAGAGGERYYDGSAYQSYTSVMGGDFKGLFNPDSTWKSLVLLTEMRADKFRDLIDPMGETARQAFEAATRIPSIQVGTATLTGSGNNLTDVTLPNVTFLRYNAETVPRIWAVKGITGNWSAAPVVDSAPFTISGSGLSALFNMRQWGSDTWWATIDSGSGLLATGGSPLEIAFKGAAAGSYAAGETLGTLSGMGSGIVTESETPPPYSGSVATGSFGHYDTVSKTMVYEGATNITGTMQGATSFLNGTPPNYTTVTDMTASGTYTTSGGSNTLFGMNITGTGISLGTDGFLNLRFGGIRGTDTIEGIMKGFYVKNDGDGHYDAGFLKSGTLTGSLATGTWSIPSGSLSATFQETLPALPVVTQGTSGSGLVGGGLSGSSVTRNYYLTYTTGGDPPIDHYASWGIWTMAAGGSGTPASSWTARSGWSETGPAYGLMTFDGTGASGRMAGTTTTGLVMSRYEINQIDSGSLLGTYNETSWQAVALGTYSSTPLTFVSSLSGNMSYVKRPSYLHTPLGLIHAPVTFELHLGSGSASDAHALVPGRLDDAPYHIYTSRMGNSSFHKWLYPSAYLNQNVVTGPGTESIILDGFQQGNYFYSVYRSGSSSTDYVVIKGSDGSPIGDIYWIPIGSGDWWNVFKLAATSYDEAALYLLNTLDTYYSWAMNRYDDVSLNALFGSTSSLFGTQETGIPVTLLGTYEFTSGINDYSHYGMFTLYPTDYAHSKNITYDGGTFYGYLGAAVRKDPAESGLGLFEGRIAAIAEDSSGAVSLIKGSIGTDGLTGTKKGIVYPDIGMVEAYGSVDRIATGLTLGFLPASLPYGWYDTGFPTPPTDQWQSWMASGTYMSRGYLTSRDPESLEHENSWGAFFDSYTTMNTVSFMSDRMDKMELARFKDLYQIAVWDWKSVGHYGTKSNAWVISFDPRYKVYNGSYWDTTYELSLMAYGNAWSNGRFTGKAFGYSGNASSGKSYLLAGDLLGTYNDGEASGFNTYGSVATGFAMETATFLNWVDDPTDSYAKRARLSALGFPITQSFSVDLNGTLASDPSKSAVITGLRVFPLPDFPLSVFATGSIGNSTNTFEQGRRYPVTNADASHPVYGALDATYKNSTATSWLGSVDGLGAFWNGSSYVMGAFHGRAAGTYTESMFTGTAAGEFSQVEFLAPLSSIPFKRNSGGSLISEGTMTGLLGTQNPLPWPADYSTFGSQFLDVELYATYTPGNSSASQVFLSSIGSYNYANSTSTTKSGAAFTGYLGGTHQHLPTYSQDGFEAVFAALFVDQSGNAGIMGTSLGEASYNCSNCYWGFDPATGAIRSDSKRSGVMVKMGTSSVTPAGLSSSTAQRIIDFWGYDPSQTYWNHYLGKFYTAAGDPMGSIRRAGTEYDSMTYPMTMQWISDLPSAGIWSTLFYGSYSNSTSLSYWLGDAIGYLPCTYGKDMGLQYGGDMWSDYRIQGYATGYWSDITSTLPVTGIMFGEIKGTYDPTAWTYQLVGVGGWLETNKFLEMASTEAGRKALQALNVPSIEVGVVSLTGTGNNMTLNINNAKFFARTSGGVPTIWATGNVSGSYSDVPTAGPSAPAVGLSNTGSTVTAQFYLNQWTGGKWLGRVINGSGNIGSSANVQGLSFRGTAAGNYTGTTSGSLSGTAAGISRK
jgi:hypothetical protein